MTLEPTDLAYLAGIIDSIGRLRIHESAEGTKLAHVGVSSPDLVLLDRCASLTGVRVTRVRRDYDRLGCSAHCAEPHLHVLSLTGRWQLVGARATIVLTALLPYLVGRHDEAVEILDHCGDAPQKRATARKMNALGWEIAS
jgi:hypothetical protein